MQAFLYDYGTTFVSGETRSFIINKLQASHSPKTAQIRKTTANLGKDGLERRLFPAPPSSRASRPLPVWSEVHRELRRKSVTLALLWEEYKALHPEGLQYSWFCDQYRAWAAKLDLVMRQEHRAGEKLFVDYAGQTVPVVDRETGEERDAQVFVAVLGASSYTFAEATWTQTLPDWIGSHVRAFEFFGGCPELVIPD